MPKDSTQEFLDRIAQIESSDNYMAKHRTMPSGMHRGMAAVGRYGLMPLTIAEIVQKHSSGPDTSPTPSDQPIPAPEFVGPIPPAEPPTPHEFQPGEAEAGRLSSFLDPRFGPRTTEYRKAAVMLGRDVSEHPEVQDYLARQMAMELLQRTGGDQDRAAYMWNQGTHMPIQRVTPQKMDASDYVQKFRALAAQDSDVPQLEEMASPKPKRFNRIQKMYTSRSSQQVNNSDR